MDFPRGISAMLVGAVCLVAAVAEGQPSFDLNLDGVVDVGDVNYLVNRINADLPNPVTIYLPGDVPIEMVRIPAGTFLMGSLADERSRADDEGPTQTVTITNDFYMSKTEVTQWQWLALMGGWPGAAPDASNGLGDGYPAYRISWFDAMDFTVALNALMITSGQAPSTFRLPTEAEWEYACRAGTQTRFFFGDSLGANEQCEDSPGGLLAGYRTDYMWYCGNNGIVGSKATARRLPNQFGLHDMAGNVWEWCYDVYGGYPGGALIDPFGPTTGSARVRRGGVWYQNVDQGRSANRDSSVATLRSYETGFRVCFGDTAPPPPPPPGTAPDQPINTSPTNGATSVSLTPTLGSSAFNDPDAGDTHAGSQWQVRKSVSASDYSSAVFDFVTDTTNLTSITIPASTLDYSASYSWRVRHRDNSGVWSPWSAETEFSTLSFDEGWSGDHWTWNPATSHYYRLTTATTWSEAQAFAEINGAHLTAINDAAEEEWLDDIFNNSTSRRFADMWIGYTDAAEEGVWRWTNGDSVTHSNWFSGQPDSSGGAGYEEDGAAMNYFRETSGADPSGWNDVVVDRTYRVVLYPGVVERDYADEPYGPTNTVPVNGATDQSLSPMLRSSAFSDPNTNDTHAGSRWQIRVDGSAADYSATVYDASGTTGNLVSHAVPGGLLAYSTPYYFRVRHQDNHGAWSAWSNETSFSTGSDPGTVTIADDFEDGTIDTGLWDVGGWKWGVGGIGSGGYSWSHDEIQATDGYLRARIQGPTSGNTYGAAARVRTKYNYNDGAEHVINFTWGADVSANHVDYYAIQVTKGYAPYNNYTLLASDHADWTQLYFAGNPAGGGAGQVDLAPTSWSIKIDGASNTASLYEGPNLTGDLHSSKGLNSGEPWYVEFILSDGTSAGYPGTDNSLFLYSFSSAVASSGAGLTWTQATAAAPWSARNTFGSVVYDGKMWVIGGHADGPFLNDVWYSLDGANWREATSAAPWAARRDHTVVVHDGKMWVIGGNEPSLNRNDVWYSSDGVTWLEATSSAPWSARHAHTSVAYDDKMWVIGGYDNSSSRGDVWYSQDGANWTQATTSATLWTARSHHTSVVHDGKMWVIGGNDGSFLNDVWHSQDGVNWTEATSTALWVARWSHTSVVYDGRIWIIGGEKREPVITRYNDAWCSQDGANWTEVTSAAPWASRHVHASVVHSDKMWVLGGSGASYYNDVWYSPSQPPVPANLIAHYSFAGNANDESGNGNHGTAYGPALASDRLSSPNSAYSFDGDDYIAVPDSPSLRLTGASHTFCAWVYPTQFTGDQNRRTILRKMQQAGGVGGYVFGLTDDGHMEYGGKFAGQDWVGKTARYGALNLNEWSHVAAVYDGSAVTFYLNGTSIDSLSHTGDLLADATDLTIGRLSTSHAWEHFWGRLDDIRIYGRALSSSEILAIGVNESRR